VSGAEDAEASSFILLLRVKPHARRVGLLGWHGDALKLAVRAAPERGRANDEVLELLAEALSLPLAAVRLETGAASQDKRVRVRGIGASEARRRIDAVLSRSNRVGRKPAEEG